MREDLDNAGVPGVRQRVIFRCALLDERNGDELDVSRDTENFSMAEEDGALGKTSFALRSSH